MNYEIYQYSKIRNYLYLLDINKSTDIVIVCFRYAPNERFTRIDFGTLDSQITLKDFHPVNINLKTKIKGIELNKFYKTIFEIVKDFCHHNSDNIIVIEGESITKHRLLRRFLNKDFKLASTYFNIFIVKDNEQYHYNELIDSDAIIFIPKPNF